VGNLNTVKLNQRRFAPTPAHIAGIKCPHHWNTQLPNSTWVPFSTRDTKRICG
jgi:hypothetical protein